MAKEISFLNGRNERDIVLLASTVDMSNIFYDGIVQQLAKRQWEVHVVSSPGSVGQQLFGQDAVVHEIKMNRGISPFHDFTSMIRWLWLLSRVRPQVLVVGTPKASLLGGLAARIMGTPRIIYVIHGLRSEKTEGLMSRVLTAFESLTLLSSHRVIAVSNSLKSAVEQVHPRFKDRIEVLGYGSMNGVQLSRFTPTTNTDRVAARKRLNLPDNTFIVGFVGRLHRDKGGDFLVRLMRHEGSRRLNLHLLVIGTLEDEALSSEVDDLVSQGRATVTGWTNHPEYALQATDILLHPTRREGLGMSLLEAQAAGIPVLTTRVTGTVDALLGGVGGQFVEIDSLTSWLEAIETLSADPALRKQMGKKGRTFVEDRYDRDEVVKRFVDFLDVVKLEAKTKTKFPG